LPTPGQTPLELDADAAAAVAAAAAVDGTAMDVPVRMTTAIASGTTDVRSWNRPLQNIPIPSPELFAIDH
jgi:hypothetical protein